jgi:hypothetical protein
MRNILLNFKGDGQVKTQAMAVGQIVEMGSDRMRQACSWM